jgi:hypothetical protein
MAKRKLVQSAADLKILATLKAQYVAVLGREISDSTWYSIVRNLCQVRRINKPSEIRVVDIKLLATLRKDNPRMPINADDFTNIMVRIDDFSKIFKAELMTCEDFKRWIVSEIPYPYTKQVPASTIYRWFQLAGTPYKRGKTYPKIELLKVFVYAIAWLERRKRADSKKQLKLLVSTK